MWAGPVPRLHIGRQSRRAGPGRAEGGAREGGRAGRANGAAGLAGTLRPDSTGSGRATGRPRPRPKSGASKRASEAAPRGKSRGPVPSEGARGPVHLLSAARAARPRRPRGPRRARACAVPLPGPQPGPARACACAVPSGSRAAPPTAPRAGGQRAAPGWCRDPLLVTQPPEPSEPRRRARRSQFAFSGPRERPGRRLRARVLRCPCPRRG